MLFGYFFQWTEGQNKGHEFKGKITPKIDIHLTKVWDFVGMHERMIFGWSIPANHWVNMWTIWRLVCDHHHLGYELISHQTRKGTSSTQTCLEKGDMLASWRVSSFESAMLLCSKEFVWVSAKFTPGNGGNLKRSSFGILLKMCFLIFYKCFTTSLMHQSLTCEARSSGAEWCLWWWWARCFRRRDFFWGNFILGKLCKTSGF